MSVNTHRNINYSLCGKPVEAGDGCSRVVFEATEQMAVDDMGLTHGGFVFGLADHAAMLAVNHSHVVLGAAEVTFVKPVQTGDLLEAKARVVSTAGKKQMVDVQVKRNDETLFSGTFTCFILGKHVLDVE